MVEFDGTVHVAGPDGPVPFLDLFQGRDELVVYKHMWYDGAPHQGQCEGCTTTAWHMKDAVYLNARGVSFAILTTGRWDEVAPHRKTALRGITGRPSGPAPPGPRRRWWPGSRRSPGRPRRTTPAPTGRPPRRRRPRSARRRTGRRPARQR